MTLVRPREVAWAQIKMWVYLLWNIQQSITFAQYMNLKIGPCNFTIKIRYFKVMTAGGKVFYEDMSPEGQEVLKELTEKSSAVFNKLKGVIQ